jgi:hypothetical protein
LPDPKGPNAIQPKQDPKIQIEQMKSQVKMQDIQTAAQLQAGKLQLEAAKVDAQIKKLEAEAILALADAQGVETGHAIAMINAQLSAEKSRKDTIMESLQLMHTIQMDRKEASQSEGKSKGE